VFVSESVAEHRLIEEILRGSVWKVYCLCTCRDAIERVSREHTPVVVCERKLPDGYWTDFHHATSALDMKPEIIVTSKQADARLWAEVLNLGGSDVLGQPLETGEVVASVSAAWRRWNHRQHAAHKIAARSGSR